LVHEFGNRLSQIYHQIGGIKQSDHLTVEVEVVTVVALFHLPAFVQISRKDMAVLINRSILYRAGMGKADATVDFKAMIQKVNLQRKAPARHIVIKIFKVRVIAHGFKMRFPAIMLSEHACERSLACAD